MSDFDELTERKRKFVAALTELSREHGIIVHGCGCCALHEKDSGDGYYRLDVDVPENEYPQWSEIAWMEKP